MLHHQITGWSLVLLVSVTQFLPVLTHPGGGLINGPVYQHQPQQQQQQQQQQLQQNYQQIESRKFAEKPNAMKKVAIDNDLDDVSTNQISDGFSWGNMLSMVMQMLFNPSPQGPNKSEGLDNESGMATSPWANIISVGLKILTAILGGGSSSDGIDKVDNSSPMQGILAAILSAVFGARDPDQVSSMAKQAGEFIGLVVNLLDTLKTSFSHRSMSARALGKKDTISEAAAASLAIAKGFARSYKTSDEICTQKYACQANRECSKITDRGIFCQLSSYMATMILDRFGPPEGSYDNYNEAGRRGRSGEDCEQLYSSCKEDTTWWHKQTERN